MSRPTQDPAKSLCNFAYGALTLSGLSFQIILLSLQVLSCSPTTPTGKPAGLGSFLFARRYLGNRFFFLFLRVLRCFSSPRSLLYAYRFSAGYRPITTGGFPHSDICGLTDICSSPQLFAACHVLLRRPVPRHPPCALSCLTFLVNSLCEFAFLFLVSLGAKS